jgi:hypothetical protein
MDVLLMRVAPKDQLQLRRRHRLTNHMQNIVPDDPLRRRKVSDPHLDDPTLHLRNVPARIAPMLAILLHLNVFRLPVVRLHVLIQVVRPLVLQRQNIKKHRLPTVDHFFCRKGRLRLVAV